jgi:hypothetical protein
MIQRKRKGMTGRDRMERKQRNRKGLIGREIRRYRGIGRG